MSLLGWAITFFIIALIAALFGFTSIAAAAAGVTQILFFVFLALFLVFLILGIVRRPRPHTP